MGRRLLSYTEDVYKRQGDSREMCLYYTTKTGEPYSQDRRVFPKVLADGTYVYTPVSYTHLDVYKRQAH